jgi:hypothetical protein
MSFHQVRETICAAVVQPVLVLCRTVFKVSPVSISVLFGRKLIDRGSNVKAGLSDGSAGSERRFAGSIS